MTRAHNITVSAPITRRAHGITSTVRVLRCEACPKWKAEVNEVGQITGVWARHVREATE